MMATGQEVRRRLGSPRMARVVAPNYPHHVVQRGHNREVVFAEPADCEYYLETLPESKAE
jgi:putative transposase